MLVTASIVGLIMLSLGFCLAFLRLIRGPTMADRIVALDLCATVLAISSVILAIRYKMSWFLDIALIIAVVTFIGTVAIARYLDRGGAQ